jgi:DNA-cytosine methyltransferase
MTKLFADLLCGGGLATAAAIAAGLTPIWAVESDNNIADCYERNFGNHVIRDLVQNVDYSQLPPVWLMHMSPVCTNASIANSKGKETEFDIDIAKACVRAIRQNKPINVTIENVRGYQRFKAYRIVLDGLKELGYQVGAYILNSANYGVPQTRIRLIVMASLSKSPSKPLPTHQKAGEGQAGLFSTDLPKWVGWYEAIEDLIPDLPESKFADWQLSRLPAELSTMLVGAGGYDGTVAQAKEDSPCFTITANQNQKDQLRAFIINESSTMECRAANEPCASQVASGRNLNQRAFIIDGKPANYAGDLQICASHNPVVTLTATQPQHPFRAWLDSGKVVKMTPRCLARFQSLPDWYELPPDDGLSCKIIGNGVAVLKMQRVFEQFK